MATFQVGTHSYGQRRQCLYGILPLFCASSCTEFASIHATMQGMLKTALPASYTSAVC